MYLTFLNFNWHNVEGRILKDAYAARPASGKGEAFTIHQVKSYQFSPELRPLILKLFGTL